MNYQALYDRLILAAKLRNTPKGGDVVVESHHIIPRHCGGSNLKENKVNLTLREHYICHILLEKIYRGTPYHAGMCRAVVAMNERGGVSSTLYENIRESHILNLRNQKISAEQKQTISQANKGNKSRTGHKNSPEHIEIIRQSRTGSKHSVETKIHLSKVRKGRQAINKGKTGNLSPLFGIDKPKISCPYCNKIGGVPAMHRHHFDNCGLKKVI